MTFRYVRRKAVTLVATLYATVTFNFLLFHVLPGSPIALLARAGHLDATARHQLTVLFGLNRSLPVQYVVYLKDIATGNLGFSYYYRLPVSTVIGPAITNTLILLGAATLLTIGVGVLLGVFAASRVGTLADSATTVVALGAWSMPDFFTGMLLIFAAGVWFHFLPISGLATAGLTTGLWGHWWDVGRHLVLPALTLAVVNVAQFSLITRNAMAEAMVEDYMLTARAKGVGARLLLWRHALRNALLPVATATALYVGMILGGAIQVETVFSWPGMGLLVYNSVEQRDYPVLEASFLIFALAVILTNFAADLFYTVLDPRVQRT
jgi:peptide/nickel transport system permease protein